ncbi:hypothetical protein HMPREF0262_01170 [Clostridium sp. ATCC 29733]|nr:hypothetical protein HMPREF0262_01170 [Clostridium sp. ATCC 29733]
MMDNPTAVRLQVVGVDDGGVQNLINRVGKHPCRYYIAHVLAVLFISLKSFADGICVN